MIMNRAKAILGPLRIATSVFSTRLSPTRPLSYQVTHFSSQFSNQSSETSHRFHNTHQKLFFSSKSDSMVDLVLREYWSAELENKLGAYQTRMTPENVIYVLKELEQDPPKACKFFKWVRQKNGFRPSDSVYCLMLKIAAQSESLSCFWALLEKTKELGFRVDDETCDTISKTLVSGKKIRDAKVFVEFQKNMVEDDFAIAANKVAGVILWTDWNDELEKDLGELEIAWSDSLVIRVLKELSYHPLNALKFFHWVGLCCGFEHSVETYRVILKALARNESVEEFWSMVEEMKDAGYPLDLSTYIQVSRQMQNLKMVEEVVKLYELMMDGPVKPDVDHCNLLLRSIAASACEDSDLVFRVVKKYKEAGYPLSKIVYSGIHRCLAGMGNFDEAERIVKEMRDAGYEPDNIIYSQTVLGLCRAKKVDEACKLVLEDMEAQGCRPDVKTWTILIQGLFAADEADKALTTYIKMMEQKYETDAVLLDVLLSGLISQKRVEGAYQMLVEMVKNGHLKPWQSTYKHMIGTVLGEKKFRDAVCLLQLMKMHDYPPYTEPFYPYISKYGTADEADEFLKAVSGSGKKFPSPPAYLNIFTGLFQEDRASVATKLLEKCPHHIRGHSKISALFS